nr:MAG TPA: hypothetical protein [Caudoviricetes sp.]
MGNHLHRSFHSIFNGLDYLITCSTYSALRPTDFHLRATPSRDSRYTSTIVGARYHLLSISGP